MDSELSNGFLSLMNVWKFFSKLENDKKIFHAQLFNFI